MHKDLIGREFVAYPNKIKGKSIAFRSPDLLGNDTEKKSFETWYRFWDAVPKKKEKKI